MDTLISILSFTLIGIAVAPLLLLAVYVVADYFGLRMANHILDATIGFLKLQWLSGGVLNILGGFAIAAMGVWATLHVDPLLARCLSALLIPFGFWRTYRGVTVLRAMSTTTDSR